VDLATGGKELPEERTGELRRAVSRAVVDDQQAVRGYAPPARPNLRPDEPREVP